MGRTIIAPGRRPGNGCGSPVRCSGYAAPMLDAIQQRILGVLIEKELTVPDSYPLTENALLSGCNQKSNRDPEMALETAEIHGALLALRESGAGSRASTGAGAARSTATTPTRC